MDGEFEEEPGTSDPPLDGEIKVIEDSDDEELFIPKVEPQNDS